MAVEAARACLAPIRGSDVGSLYFATTAPPYVEKLNASIVHAATALPRDVRALDLALPALKGLDEEGRRGFLAAVEQAIRADQRVSLHEFVLLTLLRHQLAPGAPRAGRKRIEALRDDALALLSLIAYAGGGDAASAFGAGVAELGLRDAALLPRECITPEAAGAALDRLRGLAPLAKALLVKAMFAAAASDGKLDLGQTELLRLAGAVLDCPLPPLVD